MATRPKTTSKLAYSATLSAIHDQGFGAFARRSSPALLALLRDYGHTSGQVVDLGCGSGIFAAELVAAGYDVLGIDQSPAMVRLAREQAPGASFRSGSFIDAKLPDCIAVTAISEVVNYLFDTRNGPGAMRKLLRRVFAALEPGGVFVFDFAGPGRGKDTDSISRRFEGADWTMFVETSEDTRKQLLERSITTFQREGKLWRREQETHRLRLYRPSELLKAARAAGFRASTLRSYGELEFHPTSCAIVARKP